MLQPDQIASAHAPYPSAGTLRVHPAPEMLLPPEPDRPGLNRFDDPDGRVAVRYTATRLIGCLRETLARFRPSPHAEAALAAISGIETDDVDPPENDTHAIADWLDEQRVGTMRVTSVGPFIDIERDELLIATTGRVRRVTQHVAGNDYLVHHVSPELVTWGLRTEWRDERRVMIADPARTMMELLGDPALGGGIRHVAEILENYLDAHVPSALIEAGDRLGNGAAFKRLGYILEETDQALPELIEACNEHVTPGVSALDPTQRSSGPRAPRWHLRVNVDLGGAS